MPFLTVENATCECLKTISAVWHSNTLLFICIPPSCQTPITLTESLIYANANINLVSLFSSLRISTINSEQDAGQGWAGVTGNNQLSPEVLSWSYHPGCQSQMMNYGMKVWVLILRTTVDLREEPVRGNCSLKWPEMTVWSRKWYKNEPPRL